MFYSRQNKINKKKINYETPKINTKFLKSNAKNSIKNTIVDKIQPLEVKNSNGSEVNRFDDIDCHLSSRNLNKNKSNKVKYEN